MCLVFGTVIGMRGRRQTPLCRLVLAALLLAACSGGGTEQALPTPTAPPAPTPTPTAAPVEPDEVLGSFVDSWEAGDWPAMNELVFAGDGSSGADLVSLYQRTNEALEVTETSIDVSDFSVDGRRASADLAVGLELDRLGSWSYDTTVSLIEVSGRWWVEWSIETLHPALREGRSLSRRRVWPQRGRLLSFDDVPLRTDVAVVEIGVEPRRIEDRDRLLQELEAILDADPDEVAGDLDAPGVQPDWFIPVATVREADFGAVEIALERLDGVVTREGTDRRGPVDGFAAQVLGATGPITAEQLDQWGEPYDSTSIVGRSGLELVFEPELAGTPSGDVRLLDPSGDMLSVLARFPGRAPVDLRTTLDGRAQLAAEEAVAAIDQPVALVAIDAASGEIRASVSRPFDEFNRALAGSYPPGSTFKTVTAAAFLADGATPGTTVQCPGRVVVTGRPFENAGGSALGAVSLQTAYARSCNTAFVNVSEALPEGALSAMAADFGFDTSYSVGINTVGGSVPRPIDDADLAASAIGQGRVSVSPLHMATVAAAVADGVWRPPTLVLDPAPSQSTEPVELDEAVVSGLQQMMRAVVTNGTGTAAASAGGDISGKTGSAEFGDADPPETHAWFIGYRDGLAFAVLVEGGGGGGSVAAPLAADFLARLDG